LICFVLASFQGRIVSCHEIEGMVSTCFLSRDASAERGYEIAYVVCLSVRLSASLSVLCNFIQVGFSKLL